VPFSGRQVKVYAAKAPNHGIAAFSIDGGAETNVDLYRSSRLDQVLLWTSPVLAPGTHTLKVRVTGTKNARSSGVYVPSLSVPHRELPGTGGAREKQPKELVKCLAIQRLQGKLPADEHLAGPVLGEAHKWRLAIPVQELVRVDHARR
jgi:hypothetical protein